MKVCGTHPIRHDRLKKPAKSVFADWMISLHAAFADLWLQLSHHIGAEETVI
jgi:hypothetical protein